jgi:hypothetical protein
MSDKEDINEILHNYCLTKTYTPPLIISHRPESLKTRVFIENYKKRTGTIVIMSYTYYVNIFIDKIDEDLIPYIYIDNYTKECIYSELGSQALSSRIRNEYMEILNLFIECEDLHSLIVTFMI